jgi:hypothetical protein
MKSGLGIVGYQNSPARVGRTGQSNQSYSIVSALAAWGVSPERWLETMVFGEPPTQRADVGSIRAIWAVQDKLALNADEEMAIELNREFVGGQERTVWNPSLFIPAKEFEFTDTESARIRVAIEAWDNYGVAPDRRWLEPLIDALFSAEPRNSSGDLRLTDLTTSG